MWKNIIHKHIQVTDDNMAHAHCMLDTKGTYIHSEYVILIAFPLQQWLNDAPQCYALRTSSVLRSASFGYSYRHFPLFRTSHNSYTLTRSLTTTSTSIHFVHGSEAPLLFIAIVTIRIVCRRRGAFVCNGGKW